MASKNSDEKGSPSSHVINRRRRVVYLLFWKGKKNHLCLGAATLVYIQTFVLYYYPHIWTINKKERNKCHGRCGIMHKMTTNIFRESARIIYEKILTNTYTNVYYKYIPSTVHAYMLCRCGEHLTIYLTIFCARDKDNAVCMLLGRTSVHDIHV